jgi:hypothetical protein
MMSAPGFSANADLADIKNHALTFGEKGVLEAVNSR